MFCLVKRLEKKTTLFFSLIIVIEMKTKALHRLDSVKLDLGESDNELEMIVSTEVQAAEVRLTGDKDVTGLRQRKTRKSENTQSDAQIIKRSLSAVKDAATDEFDFEEETGENKSNNDDDEEEIETGSVGVSLFFILTNFCAI